MCVPVALCNTNDVLTMNCLCRWLVSDGVSEISDHHADPDPGPIAVCCSSLPLCRGTHTHTHTNTHTQELTHAHAHTQLHTYHAHTVTDTNTHTYMQMYTHTHTHNTHTHTHSPLRKNCNVYSLHSKTYCLNAKAEAEESWAQFHFSPLNKNTCFECP